VLVPSADTTVASRLLSQGLSGSPGRHSQTVAVGDAVASGVAVVPGDAAPAGDSVAVGEAVAAGDAVVAGEAVAVGDAVFAGDAVAVGEAVLAGEAALVGDADAVAAGDESSSQAAPATMSHRAATIRSHPVIPACQIRELIRRCLRPNIAPTSLPEHRPRFGATTVVARGSDVFTMQCANRIGLLSS
jgi:hypothetical protein